MRQIEVINQETIIDVTAETSNVEILVRDYDSELVERFALEAQEASIDAEESADIATAQASIATAQATIATTQAGIATTQAGIATTQSGIATTKANEASASAASALASEQAADADRILAQTAATTATTQAGIATTQAGIATTKAGEASDSAAAALASETDAETAASTATTQAGIATTQAGIATTQAGNALTSANNAAASAASAASAALNTPLTGFTTGANSTILATDTTLQAFGKTQGQINARVSGTGTSGQVAFWNGTSSQTGDNGLFWDNTNKRLGVGTTTPDNKISVLSLSGEETIVNIGKSGVLNSGSSKISFGSFNGTQNNSGLISYEVGLGFARFNFSTNTTSGVNLFNLANDKVGIGTLGPGGKVEIRTLNNDGLLLVAASVTATEGPVLGFQTTTGSTNIATAGITIKGLRNNTLIFSNTTSGRVIDIAPTGNLLLNTTTDAGFRLDVNGTARVQGNLTTNLTAGSVPFIGASGLLSQDNSTLFWDNTNKRLGVGTNAPNAIIDARGIIRATGPVTTARNLEMEYSETLGSLIRSNNFDNVSFYLGANQSVRVGLNGLDFPRNADFNLKGFSNRNLVEVYNSSTGAMTLQTTANYNLRFGVNNAINAQMFGATGNVLIQNGGTFTDAGFRLDVNGTARVQGAVTSTASFPSFIASSTAASSSAGFQCLVNSGASNGASFLAYGSGVGNGLGNNAGFGSSTSIVVFGNSANQNGGTTTIKLRPGGFGTNEDALVAYQSSVSIGTTNIPVSSAVLEVVSTTKGFLPPRMTTTQRNAIASPATGLVVFDTTLNQISYYNGTSWINL
jgi:hypothetical protein